jgi:prophage tail gpP-like protein
MTTNLALEATIVTNGKIFPGWESVEIWREYGNPVSYMKFVAAEDENLAASYSVVPGDLAQGLLCGQQVINGQVITRQVVFDKGTHSVEVVVASMTQNAIVGIVQNRPGQYRDQTIMQIITTALAAVSVTPRLTGETSGAEIPFERVSEHIGERAIDFVSRLAMWRNLHLTDDANGNLVLTRAGAAAAAGATLIEGQNIEAARLLENRQFTPNRVAVTGQRAGNDQTNGTASSQVFASQNIAGYVGPARPFLFAGEQPASQQEHVLRLNHAIQIMNLDQLEATITVPGWLMDNGQLWISLTGGEMQSVTIYSPMLFPSEPNGQATLLVKAVKHVQDNQGGTRTEVTCCLRSGFGNAISTSVT